MNHKPHAGLPLKDWTQITEGHATFNQRLLETERTAAHWDKTSKHHPQMYAISNVVDIWGAKVRKLATYYGWSNVAGGKPKLNNIKGAWAGPETFLHPEFHVCEGLAPPKISLRHVVSVFCSDTEYHAAYVCLNAQTVCVCVYMCGTSGRGGPLHAQRVCTH